MTTTYEIKSGGMTTDEGIRSEAKAIREAKDIDASQCPLVIMVEVSGTYSSRTQVWPELGDTYSN